jgi:two-component system cell cycle sensor histidine kinase/response regulator CckA
MLRRQRHCEKMNSVELDLNEFITSQEQSFVRLLGVGIVLRITPAPKPARVSFDEATMRQFVTTLLDQARQLLPGGGTVQLIAEHIEVDETHARIQPGARRGEFVRLTVSDNGLGLRSEGLHRLLEQSATGRASTALPVPVVAGILQRQHGWLEAVSQEGAGTEFRLYLPKATAASVRAGEIKGDKDTILLVDDEATIRRMVKNVLQRASYEVIEAETGVQALSVWEQNRERVNLLLTDMVMPDGVTGRELALRLQKSKPALNVIYTSGYDLDAAALRDTREGRIRFLPKPYDMRRLLETVHAAMTAKIASPPASGSRLAA